MESIIIGVVTAPFGVSGWCKVKSLSRRNRVTRLKEVSLRSETTEVNLKVEESKFPETSC